MTRPASRADWPAPASVRGVHDAAPRHRASRARRSTASTSACAAATTPTRSHAIARSDRTLRAAVAAALAAAGARHASRRDANPARDEPEADAAVTSHARHRARHPHRRLPAGRVRRARRQRSRRRACRLARTGRRRAGSDASLRCARRRDDIVAWLGPAAGPQSYEIGARSPRRVRRARPRAASAFVATRPGHWRVDLYALARQRLAAAGVHRCPRRRIAHDCRAARFFSHRRDQTHGTHGDDRMASVICEGTAESVRRGGARLVGVGDRMSSPST